jgi:RNA polymerase sigma-70 factor, ECF subfamily
VRFPAPESETALHERVLNADPVAPADVFAQFMEPLVAAVQRDLQCDTDTAWDSAIDGIFEYLGSASNFDPRKGRLATYLTGVSKHKAIDRLRARSAEIRREQEFTSVVELHTPAPNEEMEQGVIVRQLWQRVTETIQDDRERAALRLILEGERSTDAFAAALGIEMLPELERRREVKRHRDRLMKVMERLGAKLRGDDE